MKLLGRLSYEKIQRYNNSPLCVMARWLPWQIPPLNCIDCDSFEILSKNQIVTSKPYPTANETHHLSFIFFHKSNIYCQTVALKFYHLTSIILCNSDISGTSPLHKIMTIPVVSKPLRPALPAIWMYSPGSNVRLCVPSCFVILSNMTVRAGILTPMANVSVANRSWKRIQEKITRFLFWKCETYLILIYVISNIR